MSGGEIAVLLFAVAALVWFLYCIFKGPCP